MSYFAKVLLDSVNSAGDRLTSFEITYPRFVHAELMTHRMLSRNAASSRAIPVTKMIERVVKHPAQPVYWGKNRSGMQAYEALTGEALEIAKTEWRRACGDAVVRATNLNTAGVHKQIVNRLLEPFMWITVLVSATEWRNFFNLRQDWAIPPGATQHEDMFNPAFPAQPELQVITYMMREAWQASEPERLGDGEWHLPLVSTMSNDLKEMERFAGGFDLNDAVKVSAGRCARVSYLTHDGRRDPAEDIRLHDSLVRNNHLSPFEHQATPGGSTGNWANFKGWRQYRRQVERGEAVT